MKKCSSWELCSISILCKILNSWYRDLKISISEQIVIHQFCFTLGKSKYRFCRSLYLCYQQGRLKHKNKIADQISVLRCSKIKCAILSSNIALRIKSWRYNNLHVKIRRK